MDKRLFVLILTLVIVGLIPQLAEAQCAMCKAVAETSSGSKGATGLNNGILYLMFMPYLLMGIVAVTWYLHKKSGKA
ncbi:MAG: hypothetical protein LAT54_01360 [Cryomorphaceae bacterium]|nr:hypothetical protein [Cryomorphaceae bacterium]